MKRLGEKTQLSIRRIFLVSFDVISIIIAAYGSLLLRFNGPIESQYLHRVNILIGSMILIGLAIFITFRLYHSLWQFASIIELKNIIFASIMSAIANILICELTGNPLPRSCYFIYFLLLVLMVGGSRFIYRFIRLYAARHNIRGRKEQRPLEKVMIIGAGVAGEKVYKEILGSKSIYKEVICFIDDEPSKWNRTIHGVSIYGGRDKIIEAVNKYKIEEIMVAMPSASKRDLIDIFNICKETKCKLKKLPGIYQFINEDVHISDLKEVEIQDLLGRDPIKVNLADIMGYVTDKVVMVTGGGGSIGSELCRQIAANKPKQLIIVDIYENNAYDIQLELKHNYPELNLETLIASVRNEVKVNKLFEIYHPDIVYHAAAHKHVPLMEDSPNEAIKNNVFGTLNVARAADKYNAQKFILISTDKAVNPTNVMGATKRLCEMIVQTYNKRSQTEYVAVRFGNVLGSNGSVIPIFKRQIKEGGPVTVTHPDIIRYFMTIPEAVSLVLQAGAYAKGGEIFILDMGEPVRIADMAKKLIKLSGYEPDVDIKIEYTGLRPGEKLYEELLMEEEGLQDTPNHMIHIGKPIEMNEDTFVERLINLKEAAYGETDDIRSLIKELVPTYQYGITPKRRKTPEIKKDSHVQVNEQVQVSKTVNI
ncbi:polysaccharide biosynthesis protein [Thomasclavelia ramosa]|uniref:polysaccharide biosynthesis protein n=1 Tax=Thomasclavelia ramosa TaxID=1547 RepID=UPI001D07F04C|nr:nucleoside-diphosphate sugar epimerase/dehydratase [Thomasclavelia ramosa]MCB6434496.1 polysaccharide biosynthesis protein [Thomasclavelia ramosa]MCB6457417.1 polysaccharide biosynthesis protein [Thomasclavelia ramosa]MCB6596045.1 polysaccharide biosynthesis protein [Thomasclavelia ramosa]MCB6599264.1 polysaccharide biosynthesis protein [Thomasclavelia ramosa]MCB6617625.1 polysaccharide biosynthesis protein [Thomasclavelia ramosa]